MEEAGEEIQRRRLERGKRIAAARRAKHWKQKQLAAAVHVEPLTVSRWERGQHVPDFEMIELLAQELDQPLIYFLVDEPPPLSGQGEERLALLLAEMEKKLIRRLDSLNRRLGLLEQRFDPRSASGGSDDP